MIEIGESVSYEHVMVDWAVAEAESPRWGHYYVIPAALAKKLQDPGLDPEVGLDVQDRRHLVGEVERVRGNILRQYSVARTWSFSRAKVSAEALRKFTVIWTFPDRSFSEIEDRWRTPRTPDDQSLAATFHSMLQAANAGVTLRGSPIAIQTEGEPHPRLIEGYGRCAVALRMGSPTLTIYLGPR